MKWSVRSWMLLAGLVVAAAYAPAAWAANCCEVTAVDAAKGVLTVRETATGETFTVQTNETTAKKFKVGQKLDTKAISSAASAMSAGSGTGVHCKCGKRADGSCWCSGTPGDLCYSPGCPRIKAMPGGGIR